MSKTFDFSFRRGEQPHTADWIHEIKYDGSLWVDAVEKVFFGRSTKI